MRCEEAKNGGGCTICPDFIRSDETEARGTSALSFKVASLFCCCWRCLSESERLPLATAGHVRKF